jgi:hypothetical protein
MLVGVYAVSFAESPTDPSSYEGEAGGLGESDRVKDAVNSRY